jgi:hypothetical protein
MAEIDKTLPNQPTEIETEEVEVVTPEEGLETGETEVVETEDGGVEVNFDPNAAEIPEMGHYANLAEVLDDTVLDPLGAKLVADYTA